MSTDRLTVPEAAERLGISQDAVYKRVERHKIKHERDKDGRLYVYVDRSETSRNKSTDSRSDKYITSLEDQVEYLRNQLETERTAAAELRRIIAGLVQRIPELEPAKETPSDEPESPVTVSREEAKGETPPEPEKAEQQPWWRRIFSG